jgi:uncharacterized protein (TIGR03435 family)
VDVALEQGRGGVTVQPVFTALERGLGLRLQRAAEPMEMFVIERAERPTAN